MKAEWKAARRQARIAAVEVRDRRRGYFPHHQMLVKAELINYHEANSPSWDLELALKAVPTLDRGYSPMWANRVLGLTRIEIAKMVGGR